MLSASLNITFTSFFHLSEAERPTLDIIHWSCCWKSCASTVVKHDLKILFYLGRKKRSLSSYIFEIITEYFPFLWKQDEQSEYVQEIVRGLLPRRIRAGRSAWSGCQTLLGFPGEVFVPPGNRQQATSPRLVRHDSDNGMLQY